MKFKLLSKGLINDCRVTNIYVSCTDKDYMINKKYLVENRNIRDNSKIVRGLRLQEDDLGIKLPFSNSVDELVHVIEKDISKTEFTNLETKFTLSSNHLDILENKFNRLISGHRMRKLNKENFPKSWDLTKIIHMVDSYGQLSLALGDKNTGGVNIISFDSYYGTYKNIEVSTFKCIEELLMNEILDYTSQSYLLKVDPKTSIEILDDINYFFENYYIRTKAYKI
jgi:hypothetical protein